MSKSSTWLRCSVTKAWTYSIWSVLGCMLTSRYVPRKQSNYTRLLKNLSDFMQVSQHNVTPIHEIWGNIGKYGKRECSCVPHMKFWGETPRVVYAEHGVTYIFSWSRRFWWDAVILLVRRQRSWLLMSCRCTIIDVRFVRLRSRILGNLG